MGPYSGMSADEAAEQLAFECDCEVCEAGGNCCGSPIGNTIGELLATAYDHGLGVEQISPKNRKVILKAAAELVYRLTA